VTFTQSAALPETMRKVAEFSFAHGLLGEGAPSAEFIGIETAAGVVGDQANIKLRFDPTYMQQAAAGKL
jgi:NitT/TauT family transport system substrate-binding protein